MTGGPSGSSASKAAQRFAAMIEANSLDKHSQALRGGFFTLAQLRAMIKEHRQRVGWSWEELQAAGREAKAREEVENALREMHEAAVAAGDGGAVAAVEEALILHLEQAGVLNAGSDDDDDAAADGGVQVLVAPGSAHGAAALNGTEAGGEGPGGSQGSSSSLARSIDALSARSKKSVTRSLRSEMKTMGATMRASLSGVQARASSSGRGSMSGGAGGASSLQAGPAGSVAVGAAALRSASSRLSVSGRMSATERLSQLGVGPGQQEQRSMGLSLLSLRMSMGGGRAASAPAKKQLSLAESATTTVQVEGFAGGEEIQVEAVAAKRELRRSRSLRSILSRAHSAASSSPSRADGVLGAEPPLPIPINSSNRSSHTGSAAGGHRSSATGAPHRSSIAGARPVVAGWANMVTKKTAAAAQNAAGAMAGLQVVAGVGNSGTADAAGVQAADSVHLAVVQLLTKAAANLTASPERPSNSHVGFFADSAISTPPTDSHAHSRRTTLSQLQLRASGTLESAASAHMDDLDWEVTSILAKGAAAGATAGLSGGSQDATPLPHPTGGLFPAAHRRGSGGGSEVAGGTMHGLLMQLGGRSPATGSHSHRQSRLINAAGPDAHTATLWSAEQGHTAGSTGSSALPQRAGSTGSSTRQMSGELPAVDREAEQRQMLEEWEQWREASRASGIGLPPPPGLGLDECEGAGEWEGEWQVPQVKEAGVRPGAAESSVGKACGPQTTGSASITADMRAAQLGTSPFRFAALTVQVAESDMSHGAGTPSPGPTAGSSSSPAAESLADLRPVHYTAYIQKRRQQKLVAGTSPTPRARRTSSPKPDSKQQATPTPTSPAPVVTEGEGIDLVDEEGLPIEAPPATSAPAATPKPPKSPGPNSYAAGAWSLLKSPARAASARAPCSPTPQATTFARGASPAARPGSAISPGTSAGSRGSPNPQQPSSATPLRCASAGALSPNASPRPASALGRGHGGAGSSRPGSAAHSPLWVLEAHATAAHYASQGDDKQPGCKGVLPVGDQDWSWGDVASPFMPSPSELVAEVMGSEVLHGVGSGNTAAAELAASSCVRANPPPGTARGARSPCGRPATAPAQRIRSGSRPGSTSPCPLAHPHCRVLSARPGQGACSTGGMSIHMQASAPESPVANLAGSQPGSTASAAVRPASIWAASGQRPTSARPVASGLPGSAPRPGSASTDGFPARAWLPRDPQYGSGLAWSQLGFGGLPVIEASVEELEVWEQSSGGQDGGAGGQDEERDVAAECEQVDRGFESDDGSGGSWDGDVGPCQESGGCSTQPDDSQALSRTRLVSARLLQHSSVQANSARTAFAASPHHPPYAALHVSWHGLL